MNVDRQPKKVQLTDFIAEPKNMSMWLVEKVTTFQVNLVNSQAYWKGLPGGIIEIVRLSKTRSLG